MLKYFNFHTQELEATSLCCFPSKKWLTSLEYTQLVDYQIEICLEKKNTVKGFKAKVK